jgi:methyltransferase (TIGR00027 family)
MPGASIITHVSDTARWVAVYRALETERPDAIFRDPFARRLAGERGAAIAKAMDKRNRADWPMIVRTAVMDEIILRAVRDDGVTQVVNLAAGFDARPWRLALPPTLRWIDVDHPVMLDEKEQALAGERTACRYEGVRLDLADVTKRRTLFERLSKEGRRTLVVSEGLLVYLDSDHVAALAADLAATPGFDLWLFDLAGPGLIKMMKRNWGKAVDEGNAQFKFAPPESTAFFAKAGWKEREWRNMMDEAFRLKRTFPMAGFFRFLGRFMPKRKREEFKRFSGMAVLERSGR